MYRKHLDSLRLSAQNHVMSPSTSNLEELRSHNPSLKNAVLLDLGGEDGSDAHERADAVYPNGQRISLRTIGDLKELLARNPLEEGDETVDRLKAAVATREDDAAMLDGWMRHDAVAQLQQIFAMNQPMRSPENPETLLMMSRAKVEELLRRVAMMFW